MAGQGRNYLSAAFLNVYNLSLLGGAGLVALATGDWFMGAAAVGLEALWLLVGPDVRPFQRAVDRAASEEREKEDLARVARLMDTLPEREWQRAKALDALRREIEKDVAQNPSFGAVLMSTELDKLRTLHISFVTLASACNRAQTYLAAVDAKELQRQVDLQTRLADQHIQDAQTADIARKNASILQKRVEIIGDIEKFLSRARGQMTLIENSVRLLRDQVLTMNSPEQLGEQLNDLLTSADAIQASAKESDALLANVNQLEPVAPVTDETGTQSRAKDRVR